MATITRRRFLDEVGRTSAALVCAGALPIGLGGCASVPYAPYDRTGGRLSLPLSAFEGTAGVLLDLPEVPAPVYVHRLAGAEFTAVLTRCTHQGCTAAPAGPRIVCPCHGSEYSPDGTVLQGPAERDLFRYPVSVADGRVWIDLTEREES